MSVQSEPPPQNPRRKSRTWTLVSAMVSTGLFVLFFVLLTRLYCSSIVKQARLATDQRSPQVTGDEGRATIIS
jgi:hypothetical protein